MRIADWANIRVFGRRRKPRSPTSHVIAEWQALSGLTRRPFSPSWVEIVRGMHNLPSDRPSKALELDQVVSLAAYNVIKVLCALSDESAHNTLFHLLNIGAVVRVVGERG